MDMISSLVGTLSGSPILTLFVVIGLGFLLGEARTDLLRWFDAMAPSRPRLVLTHGEDQARQALARAIAGRHGIEAELPDLFEVLEDESAPVAADHRRQP